MNVSRLRSSTTSRAWRSARRIVQASSGAAAARSSPATSTTATSPPGSSSEQTNPCVRRGTPSGRTIFTDVKPSRVEANLGNQIVLPTTRTTAARRSSEGNRTSRGLRRERGAPGSLGNHTHAPASFQPAMPLRSFGSPLPFSQKPLAAHHQGALSGWRQASKTRSRRRPSVHMRKIGLPAIGAS